MISVVIVNLNEAEKLEKCLKSVDGFAGEIMVLDIGSTDNSLAVCKKHGTKVLKHNFVPYVEKIRNYAISKTVGDWILVLDPDETVSDKLKEELKQVAAENKYSAVNIPRKNVFFGSWIAHTNWWPDKHVRFFKKGKVSWGNKIHEYPQVSGQVLNLKATEDLAIVHFGYESVSEFMNRQNRYSTIEAENLYADGIKFSTRLLLWKPLREFLVRFIRHGGFLDGSYGFGLTVLMMVYQLEVMVKLWELEQTKQ